MAILSGCPPQVCNIYADDVNTHPASLLTASNIAAACALVLLAGVVVLAVVYWRDERPAWKRATPLVIFTVGIAAALVALSAWLTYVGDLHPGLSPGAPPLDWYRHIGLAAMDRLSQEIFLYDVTDVTLVPVTLVLVFAWVWLLKDHLVNLRHR
ncbi:MAG TPA: hypothetical protein VF510_08235 [Ktedonobacterales bacterium]